MDSVLSVLQNSRELTADALKSLSAKFAAHDVYDALKGSSVSVPVGLGPKAWKILAVLSKSGCLYDDSMPVVGVCALIVHQSEGFLRLRRFDFEKLLLNLMAGISKESDCEFVARLFHFRMTTCLNNNEATCIRQLALSELGCFELGDSADKDTLNIVILYLQALSQRLVLSQRQTRYLSVYLDRIHRVEPDLFKRHLKNYVCIGVGTACEIALQSSLPLQVFLELIPRLSDKSKYNFSASDEVSLKRLHLMCFFELEIPATAWPMDKVPPILWALATGQAINARADALGDELHHVLSCALECFRKRRTNIRLEELQHLMPIVVSECHSAAVCRFVKWGLKHTVVDISEIELDTILAAHAECTSSFCFCLALELFKSKQYERAAKLIAKSFETVNGDNCEAESQKYDYLASCHYNLGHMDKSVLFQARSIEILLSGEIQVNIFSPNSAMNTSLVKKTERWLRYLSRYLGDHGLDGAGSNGIAPALGLDPKLFLVYFESIVLPMAGRLPKMKIDLVSILLPAFGSDCVFKSVEHVVSYLADLAETADDNMPSKLRLIDAILERFAEDKEYWSAKLWKSICHHICGSIKEADVAEIGAHSETLSDSEGLLLAALNSIYISDTVDAVVSKLVVDRVSLEDIHGLTCAGLIFLDRSNRFYNSGRNIEAIEMALESHRLFDLAFRKRSAVTGLSARDKLLFASLSVNLFYCLTRLYSIYPFPRESRYYGKQLASSATGAAKKAKVERMLFDLECRCGRIDTAVSHLDSMDVMFYRNDFALYKDFSTHLVQRSMLKLGKMEEFLKSKYGIPPILNFVDHLHKSSLFKSTFLSPLSSVFAGERKVLPDGDLRKLGEDLFLFLECSRFNCSSHLYSMAVDCFGFLCLATGHFAGFCEHFESQKVFFDMSFEFDKRPSLAKQPTFPSASFGLGSYLEDLDIREAVSISVLHSDLYNAHVLWIVFYGKVREYYRIPLPTGVWDGWSSEMEDIENKNKQVLKVKEYKDQCEKREWWNQRIKLDQRVKSLCVAIRQFISGFVSIRRSGVESHHLSKLFGCSFASHHFPTCYHGEFVNMLFDSWRMSASSTETDFINRELISQAVHMDTAAGEADNVFGTVEPQQSSRPLLLSPNLCNLPWEALLQVPFTRYLTVLSFCCATSDTPSSEGHGNSSSNNRQVGYIINPSGDLIETERRFANAVSDSTFFAGIIGSSPTEEQFLDLLSASGLFLYCGHGSGEAFVSATKIAKLGRAAPSLLIGCSSGKFRPQGEALPESVLLAYSKAKAKYVVANLWDVTDKDIDAFALALLDAILKDGDQSHIAEHVHNSRKECNLKYINGAAPVIYIPQFIKTTRQ